MTTPEGKVKAQVKRELKQFGAYIWPFMPVQNGMGKPALDWLLCVNGHFVVIESKAPGKKLTTRQEHTKAEMEAAGAKVFIVDGRESLQAAIDYISWVAKERAVRLEDADRFIWPRS
jgi:hypothetical protein